MEIWLTLPIILLLVFHLIRKRLGLRFQPTVLAIASTLYILSSLIYIPVYWEALDEQEGLGLIYVLGLLFVVGIIALAEIVLQQFITNRKVLNIIGLIVVGAMVVSFYLGS